MSARDIVMTAGGSETKTYVDDVFSTYLYTGNGSTQTITNGIDLAGKGGLVWFKNRGRATTDNQIVDTARGNGATAGRLCSNSTAVPALNGSGPFFQSNGFNFTAAGGYVSNFSGDTYASWTFRKAPKFFDVVTYTGNGANRTISHSLGQVPGMIVVKRTDTTSEWKVYHNAIANTEYLALNTTAAKATDATLWNSTTATASVFSLGTHADVNANTGTYVAYLFAHDTATDGLIQCGSFTTDGSGNATVSLGWEPQYAMIKASGTTSQWITADTARGWFANATANVNTVYANLTSAEAVGNTQAKLTATGFDAASLPASQTFVYMAIRRPNKPPTTGTQVYNAIARTGTGAAATVTGVGFAPDLVISKYREVNSTASFHDKLRGFGKQSTVDTSAELSQTDEITALTMDGITVGASATQGLVNFSPKSYIYQALRRAPGVMDQICFTGTGANKTETHSLGVAPELWLVKGRSGATQWVWGSSLLANTEKIVMPTPAGKVTDATAWNSTYPTASVLSLGTAAAVNTSAATYTAYLWATKAGITKVFSYTGNGSSQNIDCGFSAGARFIMIVRTSAAGSVYIWDTVRGVVAGNDPYLALDTTAAEVTTDDSVDPLSSGFTVNQVAASNINVNGATYIGLAYA